MKPILQLNWKDTVIDDDPDVTSALALQFARQNAVLLPDALKPDFYDKLSGLCAQATFVNKTVSDLGSRGLEHPGFAGVLLRDTLSQPSMLAWLQKITDCGPIEKVIGRVARYEAGNGTHLDWHNDLGRARFRALAVTVSLGREPYQGGEFEMRERASPEILFRHIHSKPGMMLIFRVARELLHRVLPVTAGGPRTVFSGWFLRPAAGVSDEQIDP
ncbi:MAG: 2OG-Fe(II) oxygenase [Pseudolabrys sp.]